MQHSFSWSEYILFSTATLVFYYTLVVFKFYRKELFQGIFYKNKKNTTTTIRESSPFGDEKSVSNPDALKDNLSSTVHEFVYELKTLLQQLAAQKEEKAELMTASEKLINKYPSLKGSQFQPGLINLIAAETETICGHRLDADELVSLWQ